MPNIVQVAGDSLVDRNGPFLGLGATYFSGLRFYHNGVNGNTADWNKLNNELALLGTAISSTSGSCRWSPGTERKSPR